MLKMTGQQGQLEVTDEDLHMEVQPTANPEPEPAPDPEADLPEKLRGKSPKELADMYRNLESELGRARNEIGQVRNLADELLGINRAQRQAPAANQDPPKKLTSDDLFSDPEKSITEVATRIAESRDKEVANRVAGLEAQLQLAAFEKRHGNFRETMETPEFVDWLKKTPRRVALAQYAVQGDYNAADELFTLFDESRPPEPAKGGDGSDAVRRASLARPGGSTAAKVVGSGSGKPIWSRKELLNMRINDPEEFDRRQPEILEAYKEKRVK